MENKDRPAYPVTLPPNSAFEEISYYDGLTKREAFAMAAMQGLLAQQGPGSYSQGEAEYLATQSTMIADAMLAELSKPQP